MSNVVVVSNVTLDGVMQAPGRPDDDTRGGFEHGGWAVMPNDDPDIGSAMGERMAESAGLLLGRPHLPRSLDVLERADRQPAHELSKHGAQVRRIAQASRAASVADDGRVHLGPAPLRLSHAGRDRVVVA
jgi:hypothetical protein